MFSLSISAQGVVIDISESGHGQPTGYYRKDISNLLDAYQGTYVYTNGNITFKIKLKKMLYQPEGTHFEDMLIGEYQYIENGLEKINTLNNYNVDFGNKQLLKHAITGNRVIGNNSRMWVCSDCANNQKRIILIFTDPISRKYADFVLRKNLINGVEVIEARIVNPSSSVWVMGEPEPLGFSIPPGFYTFIKQ